MDLKSINPVYLAICVIAIVCIAITLIFLGFLQPAASEETNKAQDATWDVLYLGLISSEVPLEEQERMVQAFIEHNAGVSDACTITHFYSNTCPACMQLEPWLNAFRERYPEVVFTAYEAHESIYHEQRGILNREYGIDAYLVPTMYVCGTALQGREVIENTLEPMALAVYDLPAR